MKLSKRIIPAVRIPVVGVVVILAILGCQPSEQTDVKKADQQTNLEKADQQTDLKKADIELKVVKKADQQSGPKKADITLQVSAAGLKFKHSTGQLEKCISSPNPHCVRVQKGDDAEITFHLKGWRNWEFNRIQLVAEPSDVKPSAKLNFGDQVGFTKDMRDDFYVTVNDVDIYPDVNGIIKLNGPSGVGRDFILIDKNNLAQIYTYQLEACKGESCERSDPKIENEG
ncbi:MAG: hypothetical protein QNK22_08910 [Xanthomonadales bacterium]|nr:hypothetical protein [Xanthomonadales bacterium]